MKERQGKSDGNYEVSSKISFYSCVCLIILLFLAKIFE
jgi:hypothetical protein